MRRVSQREVELEAELTKLHDLMRQEFSQYAVIRALVDEAQRLADENVRLRGELAKWNTRLC